MNNIQFAIITGLFACVNILLGVHFNKRKSKAEIENLRAANKKLRAEADSLNISNLSKVMEFYEKVTKAMQENVDKLTSEVRELKLENISLKQLVNELKKAMKTQPQPAAQQNIVNP